MLDTRYKSGVKPSELRISLGILYPNNSENVALAINEAISEGDTDSETMRNRIIEKVRASVTNQAGFTVRWKQYNEHFNELYVMEWPSGIMCDIFEDDLYVIYSIFGE